MKLLTNAIHIDRQVNQIRNERFHNNLRIGNRPSPPPRLQELKAQHDQLLAQKAELEAILSQRRIELASPEVVRQYVDDLHQFIDTSELTERRVVY